MIKIKTAILMLFTLLALALMTTQNVMARPAPLVSIPTHDAFFDKIAIHCGKAFKGKVIVDNQPSPAFDNPLIMHIRKCQESELQIPFHVGDDASRTWIIKKTGSGLSLKHDHRKPNGDDDPLTMYGGHTQDAGFENVQSFPADQYSIELFVKRRIAQSATNVWQIFIYENVFTYRMYREGREFRVDFDLTTPVDVPQAPWGYDED